VSRLRYDGTTNRLYAAVFGNSVLEYELPSLTPTITSTYTVTATATVTATPTVTATRTSTATLSSTTTATGTVSNTTTATATSTVTATPSATGTVEGPTRNAFRPASGQTLSLHFNAAAGTAKIMVFTSTETQVLGPVDVSTSPWVWDGKNAKGVTVASGVYYFFVRVGTKTTVYRTAVLR